MPGWRPGGVFSLELIEAQLGSVVVRVTGRGARGVFGDEAGGHRWQRVPPNEKRGRVHTSTVTVAVLAEPEALALEIADRDLEWSYCRASGSGGQHLQKTDSAVQLVHKPSGLTVRCETERSQHYNRATALAILRARLFAARSAERAATANADRRKQIGSGMRGDKRRTIRVQEGQVTDHLTGRTWRFKEYERGDWEA
jgi:peptide chain release factor 1